MQEDELLAGTEYKEPSCSLSAISVAVSCSETMSLCESWLGSLIAVEHPKPGALYLN